MSHTTPNLVAAFQAAPPVPADGNERFAANWVKATAVRTLPHIPAEVVGEVLMHFVSLFDSVIDALGDADPMLDWESRTHITRNIIGVAGMEMYTGAELGATPTTTQPQES